jgi:hypothetical protein
LQVQLKQLLIYLFNGGPPAEAFFLGGRNGGVGAGPPPTPAMPPGILPPRVCFAGVRSLSLVLSDVGTLSFFLSLILYLSFFVSSVLITSRSRMITIRAKGFEVHERPLKELPLFWD